jgi:hypothetical protein
MLIRFALKLPSLLGKFAENPITESRRNESAVPKALLRIYNTERQRGCGK